ncbi:LEAF RUST 10 DISEASE-RESISTANCE LOCUS RECEPTOR-LIKE PROTEIN KINASE-like 1.4 isoform X1 [Salvia miltiorrhiza]|uniref:LEAF RUST 10 DISEASE-RESISTANCE LOCUS RECEPTOR-LIKE PROTEIN KINASE-like 1.4 isoform X1 n=1 Tax=Salvia miltiorrhiza TaxID=226208 RepID=UPI0025AC723A|nr:LEAF RUST 10 DISEASE-RESISTANCE LOCUS RECEPTOR-LIKE PROTEIN KINASE-like 1.4 isoform X1 [Salvia miltiorrhiza]XP_057809426.1 LEAF RUST 10 DISEASE-RESISTANCE LOCUS RECEPTOR-LIKE PROTEIN KINASE-like 1.4 isoform X1 [Salvia miltiorrhiza]
MPLLLILAAALFAAAHCQSDTYANCDRTFSCGSITNITFPFHGGDRPPYCGLPDFALACRDGNTTELAHTSAAYRVLRLNQTEKSLVLAHSDLYSNTCPSDFRNITLGSPYFYYNLTQNEELTMFYGCNTSRLSSAGNNASELSITRDNRIRCNSTDLNYTGAFYWIGPVPSDPILSIISCNISVRMPMLRAAGDLLTNSTINLGEALMEGFDVSYSVQDESLCSECNRMSGQCGFSAETDKLICICGDKLCPFALTPPPAPTPSDGSRNTERSIGLFIAGAILTGVGLGWLVFHCRQKRKQRLALMSSQITSKEITSSPSTKGLLSPPSSNYTKSILSYPSTKSDFGRRSSDFGVQVFNCTELEEATNKFDPSRELGDGGFGTVYYGVLSDGRVVAVKRLYENNFKRAEQFINEVEILTRLRHQYLVKLYGCTSRRSQELLLVYEYVANGTVADHLHGKRAKSGLLSWPIRLQIAVETADALAYLHRSDIIHRDVKTNNILLDNDFHVKVADFGLSRLFPNDVTHVSTAPQGTPGYVDPEYYQCYQLTEKSDVYSFGVVLIELISSLQAVDTNRHRHDINLSNMAVNKIQNRTLHELVDSSVGFHTNSSVRRMVTLVAELAFRCLQQEKDMRPSMQEVLDVLKGIQNEDSNALAVEIVDLSMAMGDDAGLLKGSTTPRSQDSLP